jgi:isocitrate/isopropylmalate dehydrogenase
VRLKRSQDAHRFPWSFSGADYRSFDFRLSSTQAAERVQRLLADENRSTRHAQPYIVSKATEAEKIVEYWKNTGMERFQKQVPLIEVAQMYIARDQRFIWALYAPDFVDPNLPIGCDEFEQ